MDLGYLSDSFTSNHSLETENYDSSTLDYFEYNSSEPVTEISNKTVYYEVDPFIWPDNFLALFDKYYLYRGRGLGLLVIIFLAYMIIFTIGIVGNSMVILVVIKRPQMRTVTNLFIMNLAVADLLVIIFCVPAELLYNIFWPWLLGPVMCKSVRYLEWVSMCASAYSLTAISVDRCKAIHHPQVPPRGLSKRQALFTICLIWTISLTMTIPYLGIFKEFISDYGFPLCHQLWDGDANNGLYYFVGAVFVFYGMPLSLISISNILIWTNVSKRKAPEECASSSHVDRMHRETRHGVGKMLGIVTLAFLLSWLPLYCYMTRKFVKTDSRHWEKMFLLPVALFLCFSNSCINPVLYAFLSRQFREAFYSLLPKWMPCIHRKEKSREK